MKSFFLICTGAAVCIFGDSWQLHGQTTATATVQFSNGQTITVTDFSEPVGIPPNATVDVIVQLSTIAATEKITVASLDGGQVVSHSGVTADQGAVSFRFQATANVGLNRIELRHGARKLRMQFWVLDTANPQNNPRVITSTTPEG
jgi:hypothetical protein